MCINFFFVSSYYADEAVRLVCAGLGYPTPSVLFSRAPQKLTDYEDFVTQLTPFSREALRKELEVTRRNGKSFYLMK